MISQASNVHFNGAIAQPLAGVIAYGLRMTAWFLFNPFRKVSSCPDPIYRRRGRHVRVSSGEDDLMRSSEWLREVQTRVRLALPDVETSQADDETIGITRGLRTIVLHAAGEQVLLAPSFAAGGTIGSRLQDRVQHLEIEQYRISEATIDVAVDAVCAHLRE
jgi:hypothetical protein